MKITAKILDVETNEPVPGMSIELLNPDGTSTTKGTFTDTNGSFAIDSPLLDIAGMKLKITHVSYSPTTFRAKDVQDPVYVAKAASTLAPVFAIAKNNKMTSVIIVISLVGLLLYYFRAKLFK